MNTTLTSSLQEVGVHGAGSQSDFVFSGTSNITILGSTGSIGVNTLKVIALHPEQFRVFALTANNNIECLLKQCREFNPRYVVLRDENAAAVLEKQLNQQGQETQVLVGEDALVRVASDAEVDTVMACIVGAAGLLPTLAAANAGKRVLLANKEALVMSGALLIEAVHNSGAILLPVDSEHNAIFQCLPTDFNPGYPCAGVKRIILTASGGVFRDWPLDRLAEATPEQACQHPNWLMGKKITVDCATMMNKGLEVIEASWLFGMKQPDIHVVLHPQSVIHSLVEYVDGSMLAQLGQPDMRTPIAQTLAWPKRMVSGVSSLDLLTTQPFEFRPLSLERYPCFALALQALQRGGTATTILNAANEVAVQAFLERKIGFMDIPVIVEQVLSNVSVNAAKNLEAILAADAIARVEAKQNLRYTRASLGSVVGGTAVEEY